MSENEVDDIAKRVHRLEDQVARIEREQAQARADHERDQRRSMRLRIGMLVIVVVAYLIYFNNVLGHLG